jgi:hypothetical protein
MTYYSVLGVGPECRASRRQKIITKLETWAGPSLQNLCLQLFMSIEGKGKTHLCKSINGY